VFNFTDSTTDLNNGLDLVPVKAGDLLLNAWFVVTTAWGVAPAFGDIGLASQPGGDISAGFFATLANFSVDVTTPGFVGIAHTLTANEELTDQSALFAATLQLRTHIGVNPVLLDLVTGGEPPALPILITEDDTLQVWVSGDGMKGGPDVSGSGGVAAVGFLTVTPITETLT
jgi:hypothetical protein